MVGSIAAQWELILEPQAGATRVTQRFRYMPQNVTAARMIGVAGAEGITQACSVSLQRLKALWNPLYENRGWWKHCRWQPCMHT